MEVLSGLLLLLSLAAMLVGLFLLVFRKGRRRRGLVIFAFALVGFVIGGMLVGENNPQEASLSGERTVEEDSGAVAGDANPEAPEAAEEAGREKAGFPDEATYIHANELEIDSYALYRRMGDRTAIDAYCDWETESYTITDAANEKFGETPTGDQIDAKWRWEEEKQKPLRAALLKELGLEDPELFPISNAGKWLLHCRAREEARGVITQSMADAVTQDDIRNAVMIASLYYGQRLEDGAGGTFFNPDIFSTPDCKVKSVDELSVLACRMIALGRKSKFDYFVLGRSDDGKVLAAPLFGNTMARIKGETQFEIYPEPPLLLARFVSLRTDAPSREILDEAFE